METVDIDSVGHQAGRSIGVEHAAPKGPFSKVLTLATCLLTSRCILNRKNPCCNYGIGFRVQSTICLALATPLTGFRRARRDQETLFRHRTNSRHAGEHSSAIQGIRRRTNGGSIRLGSRRGIRRIYKNPVRILERAVGNHVCNSLNFNFS